MGDSRNGYASDLSEIRKIAYICTGILFALFITIVSIFSKFGDRLVNYLDDQIGEIVAERVIGLATAGLAEEAIATYRTTFTIQFDDPRQRVWKAQEFLALLIRDERYADVVDLAKDALAHQHDTTLYTQLIFSLRKLERHEEIVEAAQEWHHFAEEEEMGWSMGQAKFHEGWAHQDLGQEEEALDAFLLGYHVGSLVENPRAAAQILFKLGRHDEARPLLRFVIANDSGKEARTARALLQKIDGDAASDGER